MNYSESADDAARRFARRLGICEDMLYQAWVIIANAGWDGLDKSDQWQPAAVKWRDRWHEYMGTQGENMNQTPMHSIVRVGRQIFTVDMARNRHLIGEGNSLEDADWIASCLSAFHKKPYTSEQAPDLSRWDPKVPDETSGSGSES